MKIIYLNQLMCYSLITLSILLVTWLVYSLNFKVIGLKLLQPLILLLSPYSLIYCFGYILIITEDYYSLLIDMIYLSYIFIFSNCMDKFLIWLLVLYIIIF
jgi:hypothetical protein